MKFIALAATATALSIKSVNPTTNEVIDALKKAAEGLVKDLSDVPEEIDFSSHYKK